MEAWERYGRAVIASMQEVLAEAQEQHHPLVLETAAYWLSIGATLGLSRPDDARRLLALIEPEETARTELETDAEDFAREALV